MGRVNSVVLSSHGTQGGGNHSHQLARTIGDMITISESQTGHTNQRYIIIGEAHRLNAGLLETTWYLEPITTTAPYPWKLQTIGRGELNTATILAY